MRGISCNYFKNLNLDLNVHREFRATIDYTTFQRLFPISRDKWNNEETTWRRAWPTTTFRSLNLTEKLCNESIVSSGNILYQTRDSESVVLLLPPLWFDSPSVMFTSCGSVLSQGDYLLLVVPVASPGQLWRNIYPLVKVAAEASIACEVCLPIMISQIE